jgi:hypothetical protein
MSGAILHGLGDCTPELNRGCITVPSEIADQITEDARQLEGFIRSQLEIAFDRTIARAGVIAAATEQVRSKSAHERALADLLFQRAEAEGRR